MLVPTVHHGNSEIQFKKNCKCPKCFEVFLKLRMILISKMIISWQHNYLTDISIEYSWFSFIFHFLSTKFERKLSSLSVRLFRSGLLCELSEEKCTVRTLTNRFLSASSLGQYSCTPHCVANILHSFIWLC